MSIYDFIEKMNDGEVISEVKNLGRKYVSISIKQEGLVYECDLPISWPDADCVTVALGAYMTELVG
jgi:hypothetical protein